MATKTWYLTNTAATTPDWFGVLQDGGVAPTSANTLGTFTIGKLAANGFSVAQTSGMTSGARSSTSASTSFIDSITLAPGTNATTGIGNAVRSPTVYSGAFASGNWVLAFGLRPTVITPLGRIRCRVWAGPNIDGTAARELTGSTQVGTTTASMGSTTTTFTSTVTWSAPAITLINEYLFFQYEYQEQTSAGSANTTALALRVGSETNFVTTTFTAATSTHLFDYNGVLPTGFATVRASVATEVDVLNVQRSVISNTPRFDFDPATSTELGLLVEPAATNLVLQSSNMTNGTNWGSGSSTLTSLTGPLGNTGCVKVTSNGTTASLASLGWVAGPVSVSAGSNYTITYDVQMINRRYIFVNLNNGSFATHYLGAIFDINGTANTVATQTFVGAGSGTIVRTKATYLGSSWFRISVIGNTSLTSAGCAIGFADAATGNTPTSVGDITCTTVNTDAFGTGRCQLELGTVDTSFISTTTAAVTRAADAISFTLGGSTTAVQFTLEDGSQRAVGGLTPSSTYTIPTNLALPHIRYIDNHTVLYPFPRFRKYLRR